MIDSDQTAWVLANPATSDVLKQIWDYKGSIFNLYTMSNTHGGWGAGMWRIHDFIRGTGHNAPPCDNYSHCFSFSDDQDHPELIAGMTVGGGLRVDGLIHEVQHALLGFTMKDFPEANAEGACDRNPDCSRELSIDYAHIEANTTLNSDLKGPPWNPEFGYPHSIRIRKSDGSTTEPNVIYDDEDEVFKVVERTRAMQYGTSDFLLYQQGLLSAEDALKDEYKIIGYTFPGCELDNKGRVCPDGYEFPFEESIKFNVTDSIAKFGGYENPRGLNVYDPAAIKMAMIQMSGRNHTEAEYTIDSKVYRSWANDGADEERTSFDGKDLEGDPPWAFTTRGLGRIVIDFSSRIDTDSDGLPNDCDAACITAGLIEDFDDDGDGVSDENDDLPLDDSETLDTDGDGVGNNADAFPLDAAETIDTDSDGTGNNADTDDDNDTVLDADDAFPLDATETTDTDGDGLGNNSDPDDDGDGVSDENDDLPLDDSETLDTDGDGVGDNSDPFPNNALYSVDSDSDGIPDAWETKYGLDPNDPSDATSDRDNDGVSALDEFLAGTIPSGSLDIDGNENYDALTDGLLLLRGMFGLDGSALITGTIASDAAYTESVDIESRIAMLGDLADIDGNGEIDALTDGLLTLRYLFGLEGDTLINGVVAGDATRETAEEIEAHLETLMPAL